jgi:hypothetical protein
MSSTLSVSRASRPTGPGNGHESDRTRPLGPRRSGGPRGPRRSPLVAEEARPRRGLCSVPSCDHGGHTKTPLYEVQSTYTDVPPHGAFSVVPTGARGWLPHRRFLAGMIMKNAKALW